MSITGVGQREEKHKIYISAVAKDPKGAESAWGILSVSLPIDDDNLLLSPKTGYLYAGWTNPGGISLPFIFGNLVIFIQSDITVVANHATADKVVFTLMQQQTTVETAEIQSNTGVFSCNFGKHLGFFKIMAEAYEGSQQVKSDVINSVFSLSIPT